MEPVTSSPPVVPPPLPVSASRYVLPEGWEERRASSGLVYWVNTATQQRRFSRPVASESATRHSPRSAPLGPDAALSEICARTILEAGDISRRPPVPAEVAQAVFRALTAPTTRADHPSISRAVTLVGSALRELSLPSHLAVIALPFLVAAAPNGGLAALSALSLRGCSRLMPVDLIALARGCPLLERVDVGECAAVDSRSLETLTDTCPHLLSLTCDHCMGVVGSLALRAPELRALQLCSRVVRIELRCPRLQLLDISDCWDLAELTADTAHDAPSDLVEVGLFRCRALEGKYLTALLRSGGAGSPRLRYLNVSECAALHSHELEAAVRACSAITHFVATNCSAVSAGVVEALGRNCRELESVFLGGCPPEAGVAAAVLAWAGATLRGATLPRGTPGSAVAAIAAAAPQLVALDVSEQELLTDADVSAVLRSCPMLRSLSLSDCRGLTGVALDALSSPYAAEAGVCLRSIDAINVPLIDAAVRAVALRCQSLTTVDLTRNAHVTDAGVAALVACLGQLRTLTLAFCRLVSDVSIEAIALQRPRDAPKLALNVYGCEQVTAEAITGLLAIGALREVNVSAVVNRNLSQLEPYQLRGAVVQCCNTDPIL